MGDGGMAVEQAILPAEAIGGASLDLQRGRWSPDKLAARLRAWLPPVPILAAGFVVCLSFAGAILYARGNLRDALPLLVMFVAGVAVPGLALTIDGRVRKRTVRELRRANAEMDRRMRQRTQALDEARQALLQSQRME